MSPVVLDELAVHDDHALLPMSTINTNLAVEASVRSDPNFGVDTERYIQESVHAFDRLPATRKVTK